MRRNPCPNAGKYVVLGRRDGRLPQLTPRRAGKHLLRQPGLRRAGCRNLQTATLAATELLAVSFKRSIPINRR